jgi:hypothetical protein
MADKRRGVLGIDLGDNFGYCHLVDGTPREIGKRRYAKKRGASAGHRWLDFAPWFEELVHGCMLGVPLAGVWYEQTFHRGGHATAVLQGYEQNIMAVLAKLEVEYFPVPVATLKKFATGNGRADKGAMRKFLDNWFDARSLVIRDEQGCLKTLTTDEVDATWVALYGWKQKGGKIGR